MKTGLLLLQSVTSSILRPGRSGGGSLRRLTRSRARTHHTPGGNTAFLAMAAMLSSGGSALAMCSNNEEANKKSSLAPASTAPAAATAATKRKSIDEPDKTPEHNPMLPFSESSLRHDTYNGVTLDLTTIIDDGNTQQLSLGAEKFNDMLGKALEIWTLEQRKGIWLKIPTAHSHLIAPATQTHGFDFQHAERGYCVLTKWLPRGQESRLPNGPTHQVGVGALVVHPLTGKMLAVQERTGPAAKRKLWKMPTGLTDPGEDIAAAAVRELKEETGLDCVFDGIVCFRQAHGGLFGRSDMFFVCLCKLAPACEERLKSGAGDVELLPQEEEILKADWIDMEDYANQLVWKESPLYKTMNAAMIRAARRGIEYSSPSNYNDAADCTTDGEGRDEEKDEFNGFVAKNLPVGFRPGSNTIYVSSKL